jgi:carbamate kinase
MSDNRTVVALGGNALGDTLDEQMVTAKKAARSIADLIEAGHEVVVVHGNGPQVGMIETAFETAARVDKQFPVLPVSVCVALSQGYIGYDLQNVLAYEFRSRGIEKPVATIITQVEVDPDDRAFQHPSKPIGGFLEEGEVKRLTNAGIAVMEDSNRGYRRAVASPAPVNIIESATISALLKAGQVPIAVGGGGIPVAMKEGQYRGMGAVVDKDSASAKLAELIDADTLVILTTVEKVSINFGKPDQRDLDSICPDEARTYMEQGEFGKGSMLPKVAAAVAFVESGENRRAVITKLSKAKEGLEGKTGTVITRYRKNDNKDEI